MFGRLSMLAAAYLLSGCRGSTPPGEPGSPRLRFEPERLVLGSMIQDETSQGSGSIRNVGTTPLEIRGVRASRFCSAVPDAQVIAPGWEAKVVVTCRSDLYGPLREGIDVQTNDPRLPTATLSIVGDVAPLFAFDVPMVELTMPFGEEQSRDVHLVGVLAGEAHPRLTGAPAPDTDIVALATDAGTPKGYRVRCLGRKAGANAGNIVVATGLPKPREVAIPYVCNVKGTLEVSPTNPFFNLKVSGDKAVRISVRSSQAGFEVREVRALSGPFAARFEHAEDDNTYRIDVTVLADRIAGDATSAAGTLLIVSNDRTEPQKEVPLFGSGRINKVQPPGR